MSQNNLNLMQDKESKYKYEKKKRKYEELDPFSDDDSIIDEENVKGSKERIESKKSKSKNGHNNLQSLRDLRLIKKFVNKENVGTVLSQEQIEYAKKIVEDVAKDPQASLTSKLKSEIERNKERTNNENIFTSSTNNQIPMRDNFSIESSSHLSFSLFNNKDKNQNDEILNYLGLLNSCVFKIVENNKHNFTLEVVMEKNSNEMIKFLINFNKQNEDKDYVEYIPILTTFKFEGEDIIFYEELDIHKEDLGKMIRRLLNYKYK